MSGPGGGWREVGDRVFHNRYRSLDLNVGAVLGDDEALVVDTRSFAAQATELLDDLRRLTPLPCRQVVNTHAHFDHCFGNATLRPAAIWGHEGCAAHLRAKAAQERDHLLRWLPEAAAELDELVVDPPDRRVGDAGADLQVGGRRVELRFCGRGHTDHDLVVAVPDAGVVFAGDLVEEGDPPVYGADAFPLEWPATLDRLLALAPPVVVPGHGAVVGHGFVRGQRDELAAMASLCRRVAAGELTADEAVRSAPFPEEAARDALALSARAAWPAGGAAPGTARPG
ncbi:MAG TPA: MBL fold metallo-hydrolase [Actinomycetota bacterium]|nr:MBL fold metallo-hydrolase [Actinomycetota bacterium]